jgi:hypothetical protein
MPFGKLCAEDEDAEGALGAEALTLVLTGIKRMWVGVTEQTISFFLSQKKH